MTLVPSLHHALRTSLPDYHGNWWWYLTYFSNWKQNFAAGDANLGHFWSLAVEEQFYIAWPAVVLIAGRRRLPWVCAALIISATGLRYIWSTEGVYWNQIYRLTVTRWDTIAMGALASLALRSEAANRLSGRAAPMVMLAGAGAFIVIASRAGGPLWSLRPVQTYGATAAAIGFTGLILYAATRRTGTLIRALTMPIMIEIGRYSYCIYVTHLLVFINFAWVGSWVLKRFPRVPAVPSKLLVFVSANLAVFFLAKLSWRYFESPILSLKRRFAPARISTAQGQQSDRLAVSPTD